MGKQGAEGAEALCGRLGGQARCSRCRGTVWEVRRASKVQKVPRHCVGG